MSPNLPTGREVLIVEDEIRLREMLAQAAKQMGFNATLVGSAEAAHRAMALRPFDVLMLDLNLPGKGGIEFLSSLRKDQCDTPTIILTGFGDLDSAKAAIHLDVVEFLTKPCTLGKLEIALDRAYKKRKVLAVDEAAQAHETNDPDLEPEETAARPMTLTKNDDSQPVSLEEIEQRHILDVLQKNNGNRALTATMLGISLRKLYYRLGEYQKKGLIPPEEPA